MSRNEFEQRKRGIVAVLYGAENADLKSSSEIRLDRSLKGKVDDEFQAFCEMINNHPDYVTTSCCSGRITIYRSGISNRKIGGALLFVSHKIVSETDFSTVQKCLTQGIPYYSAASTCMITPSEDRNASLLVPEAEVTLKMEPFVIHIECASLLAARRLLQTASSLGFKNSGANTVGPKRVIVALRGNHRVEVPLRRSINEGEELSAGELVGAEALPGLLRYCNDKMALNSDNIQLLHDSVWKVIESSSGPCPTFIANHAAAGNKNKNDNKGDKNKQKICCTCADLADDKHVGKGGCGGGAGVVAKRTTPSEKMATAMERLIAANPSVFTSEFAASLMQSLPTKKFEKLGDALIFSELPALWQAALDDGRLDVAAWQEVASALGVRLVATQNGRGVEGTTRIPGVRILSLPAAADAQRGHEDAWVLHKENGVAYQVKIDRLMFASGNGTERARMAGVVQRGEEVVDLFSGLGYFSLPILMSKKVARLTSCDINPLAHEGLKRGVLANKRASGVRLTVNGEYLGVVHSKNSQGVLKKDEDVTATAAVTAAGDNDDEKDEGINRTAHEMYLGNSFLAGTEEGPGGLAIAGRADRILLGLIPTSTGAWAAALRVINQTRGGILHVHENATSKEEVVRMVTEGFRKEADAQNKLTWSFEVQHVEKVKSYAPEVWHYVVDLKVVVPQ